MTKHTAPKSASAAQAAKEEQELQSKFLALAAKMFDNRDNRQREEEKKEAQREEQKEEAKSRELSILYESENEQDSWMDRSQQANANPGQSNDSPLHYMGSGS